MKRFTALLLLSVLFLTSCNLTPAAPASTTANFIVEDVTTDEGTKNVTETPVTDAPASDGEFSFESLPAYSGKAYITVNGNVPFFTDDEITDASFESYSPLDSLGRCGVAFASIGRDLMPGSEREDIYMIKPTGWHSVKYDFVDGESLYNRCHLIAHQLAGENANKLNLITGTRTMNLAMIPFEEMAGDYVRETGHHVMYRVTPDFRGDNLVATGVLMEGLSVEDGGEDICFCVYCYNEEPRVVIDHKTGDNHLDENAEPVSDDVTYVLNTSSQKFHRPGCEGIADIAPSNKKQTNESRDVLLSRGYKPCGQCKP